MTEADPDFSEPVRLEYFEPNHDEAGWYHVVGSPFPLSVVEFRAAEGDMPEDPPFIEDEGGYEYSVRGLMRLRESIDLIVEKYEELTAEWYRRHPDQDPPGEDVQAILARLSAPSSSPTDR